MDSTASADAWPPSESVTHPSVSAAAPLAGLLVAQHGERLAAAVCGTLLAQLGAEVAVIERPLASTSADPVRRAANAQGRRSIVIRPDNAQDRAFLSDLLSAADVVVTSSDVSPDHGFEPRAHQIACDITAFGATGPLSGLPYSDGLLQALSGLADTTGNPQDAPTLIGFPFCEVSAGIYAAAATLVAHRVRRSRGTGQSIDIALFDCAVGALPTFLPFHIIGKPATRSGNQHSLAAPWNAYRASDGWVLICTATDDQWRRLCKRIGQPSLAHADGFATNAQRVARRNEIDKLLQDWTCSLTVQSCIEQLSGIDIACGPILTLEQLKAEDNLAHRGMMSPVADPVSGRTVTIPGSPLAAAMPRLIPRARVPRPDEDRAYLGSWVAARKSAFSACDAPADVPLPLDGLRVLEIGQYTTAPLVGRHLGALGAEVLKIEPPGGEGARAWPPTQGNRGYFFALSNSDKRSLELDLRNERHRILFRELLRTADVLVENLKPGSLARLGFGTDTLRSINSRLVYCGISGFGVRSAYPGRPAFDTVVQAMSGIMDLTRANGVPSKAGISAADIIGGEIGLVAILAGLAMRDASNQGEAIDVSMQDAAVWATSSLWNDAPRESHAFQRCADGFVCVKCTREKLASILSELTKWPDTVSNMSREAFVETARQAGIICAPVRTVSETALSGQVAARNLIVERSTADGRRWPLLNCPLRLMGTPPRVRRAIGELGEANEEVQSSLNLGPSCSAVPT
jgi:crotonobetainyl-CoA:carnitine CoA-transferase CaiB-like acyl-CoA transferase